MKLIRYPDGRLKQKCEPFEEFTEEDRQKVKSMEKIMQMNFGVGLAGPQVGWMKRVFIVSGLKTMGVDDTTFINPEILEQSEEAGVDIEGCLSIPLVHVPISRPSKILLKWKDSDFVEHEKWIDGFFARIIQHERDHLDGIMFVDRAQGMHQKTVQKQMKRMSNKMLNKKKKKK